MVNVNAGDFAWLELWVGNARQVAAMFVSMLGFTITGHAGPATGVPDRSSYLLTQGDIRLVITGATRADSPVAAYVHAHGDGVRDIALKVTDATSTRERAIEAGFQGADGPLPGIRTFGDTVHTLVGGSDDDTVPAGFRRVEPDRSRGPAVGLTRLDHVAVSVEAGTRGEWSDRYQTALSFERVTTHDEHIEVAESAFEMSTVRSTTGQALVVFAEPAPSPKQSQIAYYLDAFGGAGVHHVALATNDIVTTVDALAQRGFGPLEVPHAYYVEARRRLDSLDLRWDDLEARRILVDRDEQGHLFQLFSEPIGDRSTVYLEVIQREGTEGFGNANIRALYHAVVDQQHAREGISLA